MSDVLSDIFDTIRLRATLYFRTDFSPPWAITIPTYRHAARFHLVIKGSCHFTLANGREHVLGAGDLIVIPGGATHVLSDSPGRTPAPLEQVIEQSGFDGKGAFVLGQGDPDAKLQMVCGHFGFTEGADHPLLRALPEVTVLTQAERAGHAMLDDVLKLLARRVFAEPPGRKAAVTRLSEVFFIEMIRAASQQDAELARVMTAMTDPHVGRALELIHDDLGKAWSVAVLADEVGLSRSLFAKRFSELMGTGPMSYLADWRLQRSLLLLEQPRVSIQQVAHMVGYRSAAAFTRAFSQKFGLSPSKYRNPGDDNVQGVRK